MGLKLAQFQGTVDWYSFTNGLGILLREGGPDVYLHYSAIEADGCKAFRHGDTVEFDLMDSPRGPQARRVRRIGAFQVFSYHL
jgi:CspA family cold shock protein